jgi:hypothetical protein
VQAKRLWLNCAAAKDESEWCRKTTTNRFADATVL